MTATTIRVRVNPADTDEYVIYADVGDDCGQWWLGQRSGGRWTGWEYDEHVAGWPEFELTIPLTGPPAGRRASHRAGRAARLPGPSPVREITQIHEHQPDSAHGHGRARYGDGGDVRPWRDDESVITRWR